MSAFMAATDARAGVLVTDGAGYDDRGAVQFIGPKVTTGAVSPIAVTTRGNHAIGMKMQRTICGWADRYGVDFALETFERELPALAADRDLRGKDFLHFHIIAWSLTQGPVQLSAHNMPFAFSDGQEPLKVYRPTGHYIAGNSVTADALAAAGVQPRQAEETAVDYLEREGANLMEAMRRRPAAALPGEVFDGDQYLIGGQVDVTRVDMWGARTRTVRTWPDVVGEKIDPFREMATAA